jgi:hypothetical protein
MAANGVKYLARTISVETTLALNSLDVSAKAVQVQGPPTDLPLPEAIHHSKSLLPICKKKKCHIKHQLLAAILSTSLHWRHKSRLNLHLQCKWVLKMASKTCPETYVHTQQNIMTLQQNALPITFIIQSKPVFPKRCSARNFHYKGKAIPVRH